MAVVQNISTEVGDVILIVTDVPIVGLIALTSFTDSTVGETPIRLFKREFRYSTDGINFSEWIELTVTNLQGIEVRAIDTFFIHYRYTRIGVDTTGELQFDNNTLNGSFIERDCGPAFTNSIFAQLLNCCCDLEVLSWCINVTEKLYRKGIIPDYIIRGAEDNEDNLADRDYIDFWRAISCFFALLVIYGRKFEQFQNNTQLLRTYLEQRNLFFCSDAEIVDLRYLMNYYYDEIRQRGTIQIVRQKGFEYEDLDNSFSDSSSDSMSFVDKPIDGELLRLICYNRDCDEFLFNLVAVEKLGWNMRNASPMYRGMSNQVNVNKAYEDTEDVKDLGKYPLVGRENINIHRDSTNGYIMKIRGKNGDAGIDHINTPPTSNTIVIDPGLNYEITFFVKQVELGGNIIFEVKGFDRNGNARDLQNMTTKIVDNSFFSVTALNRQDKYYFVRGIIYAKDLGDDLDFDASTSLSDSEATFRPSLNIGFGDTLQFKYSDTCKIIPVLILRNTGNAGMIYVKDFKIKPLWTPWSTGFVNTNNFIEIWAKKNNFTLSNIKLEAIIREFLIPYNSTFQMIYL